LVVTFLAILEMARLRLIRILQELAGGEIYITRAAQPPDAEPRAEPAPDADDVTPPEGKA
jgi:chromatin segregation and condensation protein Rec8/ScpA/Scc1 (kleisin family)